jgi:hypothetical protein
MNLGHAVRSALIPLFLAAGSGLSAGSAAAQAPPAPPNTCLSCHLKLEDSALAAPARAYQDDVHAAKGFGCVECHGGDATLDDERGSMSPARGYIGRPRGRQVLEVCSRCHSDAGFMRKYNPSLRVDQATEYATSVHGQRLLKGDTKVATCASCHHPHNIRQPGDTRSSVNPVNVAETCGACHANDGYMESYGIPTDQLENYRKSVHWHALSEGGDRSAPTCNDCHGNHGAAPPGVGNVANVCGQCHSVMAEYFARSRHAPVFEDMGLPGCAGCHSNHDVIAPSDTSLGITEGSICGQCHSEGDEGANMALTMRSTLDSLRAGIFFADSLLTVAEHAGMEVSQPQFDLESAGSSLLQATAAIHTFETDSVSEHATSGWEVVTTAITRGQAALADLRFRRVGLALSTVTILILILGLLLKIRQIERPAAPAGSASAAAPGGTE